MDEIRGKNVPYCLHLAINFHLSDFRSLGAEALPEIGYVGSHADRDWDLVDSRLSLKALALEIQPRPVGMVGACSH